GKFTGARIRRLRSGWSGSYSRFQSSVFRCRPDILPIASVAKTLFSSLKFSVRLRRRCWHWFPGNISPSRRCRSCGRAITDGTRSPVSLNNINKHSISTTRRFHSSFCFFFSALWCAGSHWRRAVALLPIFADQILHCGPVGLGWMRAAPAIGAFGMALIVAYLPPMREAGKTLLWCVTGFGIATIVFGLSTALWLSLAMLFVAGALDSVSVIIRGSIVQLVTPDEMRGRVSAVNNIFIGTSNEFGALE